MERALHERKNNLKKESMNKNIWMHVRKIVHAVPQQREKKKKQTSKTVAFAYSNTIIIR